ncbi:MAG: M48 family metallopeptidase [Gammaproteobacteria bacterium]|nr:M48 family metallopeptidase [Gammaproteobacteria bacterium]
MASDSIIDDDGNTLFDYSLRVSSKARYAKLQIKPYIGLEVVIPTRFPKKAVPELVKQHSSWIERQLKKHNQTYTLPQLPEQIYLPVDNSLTSTEDFKFENRSFDENIQHLRWWVRKQAWEILPPMLEGLSRSCALDYKKVSIRSQKTRWGSCSSRGTISLNDQLVFVPPATAQYLMIHELCHTRHMNHSAKFWQLVESHCADYRDHEAVLNQARERIPEWLQYGLYR